MLECVGTLQTWWATESLISRAPNRALAILDNSQLWSRKLVADHIASRIGRRFMAERSPASLEAAAVLLRRAPSREAATQLVTGMEQALVGTSLDTVPAPLNNALAGLRKRFGDTPEITAFALRLNSIDGLAEARATAADAATPLPRRLATIRTLAELHDPDAAEPKMHPAKVPLQATWEAMEALVDKGLVKNIGVCNYNTGLIHDLMTYARIQPAMLQVEAHPYLTQEKLIRCAKGYGIDVTAFSPLGAQSYFELNMAEAGESLLGAAPVMVAAQAHGKTPAQVLLKWGIQRGTAVIPKTTKPERMRENLEIDDFELSSVEMMAINSLNQNRRFNDPGVFTEAAFNTLHPIYD